MKLNPTAIYYFPEPDHKRILDQCDDIIQRQKYRKALIEASFPPPRPKMPKNEEIVEGMPDMGCFKRIYVRCLYRLWKFFNKREF